MAPKITRDQCRDVGPFLRKLREKMLGRKLENPLRFEPEYSARTQPLPELPPGPSHKLFGNYYYLRDARRQVETPLAIVGPEEIKKLTSKENTASKLTVGQAGIQPGKVYDPETIQLTRKDM